MKSMINGVALSKHTRRWVALLPFALGAAGCAVGSGGHGDESTDEAATSQAVSSYWNTTWRVKGPSGPLDLGPDTDRTCFLTGVGGDLRSTFSPGTPGSNSEAPMVQLRRSSGRWYLTVSATSATAALEATAICLQTTAGRTDPVGWSSGQPRQVLGAVTANRRCFLTSVYNNDEFELPPPSWAANTDYVYIWHDDTNWYIGGNGTASGQGACIDVSGDYGSWEWIAGSGKRVDNLAYDPGGVQCLLTGLGGSFKTDDWNDGVYIGFNAGLGQWTMTTNNGKRGWATCIK